MNSNPGETNSKSTPGVNIPLLALLVSGGLLLFLLVSQKVQTPEKASFVPLLQLMGESTRAVGVLTTKLMNLDDMDEKRFGDNLALAFDSCQNPNDRDQQYVTELLKGISVQATRGFTYRAYIMNSDAPNACAMPGGIIMVTRGLLRHMKRESQVVAVLAHEMGHIECGHCFNSVKYSVLANKASRGRLRVLGDLADAVSSMLMRHSYDKTQEAEADAYAFSALQKSQYDPGALAGAFEGLNAYSTSGRALKRGRSRGRRANPLRDYLRSHPPLSQRIAKYNQEGLAWWAAHSEEKRYTGAQNLNLRKTMSQIPIKDEWVTGVQ